MHQDLKNKSILIVTNDAWFFVSHRLEIAKSVIAAGATCAVAAHEDESVEKILSTGSNFHHWDVSPRGKSVLTELKTAFTLFKLIKSVNPDTLHLVTIKPVLYGGLISRLLRIRSVVFAISGMGYLFQDKTSHPSLLQRIAQILYRFAMQHRNSAIIVQNKSDAAFFTDNMNIKKDRVHQLPGSGVDLKQFYTAPRKNGIPVVVLTARMLWDKGIEYFVEAAKEINKNEQQARFVLIGHADEHNPRSIPLSTLEQWHDAGIVEYKGHSDNVSQLLREADIYCLPTIYGEGLPKAVIEALASGCAVVTTDWPGCNEIIQHGVNGFLVAPKDAQTLTTRLQELIDNSELREQFGKAGRDTVVTGYDVNLVVEKTLAIYAGLHSTVSTDAKH